MENFNNQTDSIDNLYSYLFAHDKHKIVQTNSKENLNLLLDQYDRNSCIPFLGAGSSAPLGIKTWIEFAVELNKLVDINDISKEKMKEDNLPKVFEEIYNKFVIKNQKDKYHEGIKKILTPVNVTSTSTQIKLILLFDRIITTNLDQSIQNAYELLKIIHQALLAEKPLLPLNYHYLPNFDIATLTPALYYLHGSIHKIEKVLRETEYDMYYTVTNTGMPKNEAIRNLLFNLYKDKTLIYIGFSFTDKYYLNFIRYIVKETERMKLKSDDLYGSHELKKQRFHFLLMPYSGFDKFFIQENKKSIDESEEKEVKLFLMNLENEFKLKPIIYKNDIHIFYERLFDYFLTKNYGYL